MTTAQLTEARIINLTAEGRQLHAEITAKTARLKEIEFALKAHALAVPEQHQPLTDATRDGTRLLLSDGTSPAAATVTFTSDLIIASVKEGTPLHETLSALPDKPLPYLFKAARIWENRFDDGLKFRQEARRLFKDPERIITAFIRRDKNGVPVSQIKIDWT